MALLGGDTDGDASTRRVHLVVEGACIRIFEGEEGEGACVCAYARVCADRHDCGPFITAWVLKRQLETLVGSLGATWNCGARASVVATRLV